MPAVLASGSGVTNVHPCLFQQRAKNVSYILHSLRTLYQPCPFSQIHSAVSHHSYGIGFLFGIGVGVLPGIALTAGTPFELAKMQAWVTVRKKKNLQDIVAANW
jgi:hypothetical protein